MPLRTSFQHCPQCVFLPVDYAHYAAISQRIKAILNEFSPVTEDVGIDEAFLDVSDSREEPGAIALAIRQRVKAATGLTCSVGIAPNKLLAKLASDMGKPDGLVTLGHDDLRTRVWPLGVRRLWGVGPKTEENLAAMGVTTIRELAQCPEAQLVECFGKAHGHYLYRAARGMDDSPLVTHWEPRSFSRETTFEVDMDDWAVLEQTLDVLTRSVVQRLRKQGYRANTVTVKLRYADFEAHTHGCTLPAASDDLATIDHVAHACLKRFALIKPCRLIGVRVGSLRSADIR